MQAPTDVAPEAAESSAEVTTAPSAPPSLETVPKAGLEPHSYRGDPEQYYWVEYLRSNDGKFRHDQTGWTVHFSGHGLADSIKEVPIRIVRDPFFVRYLPKTQGGDRGICRILTAEQAEVLLPTLRVPKGSGAGGDPAAHIMSALTDDQEEIGKRADGHFKKRGLPDLATPTGPDMPADQIWKNAREGEGLEPRIIKPWAEGATDPDAKE